MTKKIPSPISRMRDELKTAVQRGLFHISGSMAASRIFRFFSAFIVVRVLSKALFGQFSYAQNILQFFLIFNGFGVSTAIVQFCSEKKTIEEKIPYLRYGIKIGLIFNFFLVLSILFYTSFFELPVNGSSEILLYMCLMPLLILMSEIIGSYLLSVFRNRQYSYLNILSTVLYFAGTIAGGLFFLVKGIIAGRYLAFLIVVVVELYVIRKELRLIWSARSPLKQDRKEFLKFSFVVTLTNSISQFLYLIDIFFIGLIIKDESVVAAYKTATMIPFALAFLPQSIMLFLYPYFARNIKNKQKNKKLFYKVQGYMIILNLGISLILIVFAPLVIKIIFGPQYSDSVLPFRILSFGFFVSACFRIIPGNVLASLRKVKINLYTGIITGTLNIILDIILIKKMGSVGAAIATTSMFILDALITNIYLYYFFKK